VNRVSRHRHSADSLLIQSGDLVVSNWTLEGTHTGAPFFGVAPSGRPVRINGTAILRMRDGKVVEHWGGPHCSEGIGVAGARFDAA
jgi:predicted ester cyclase